MKTAKWVLALIVALMPGLAAAQMGSQTIVTQVPFEFVAGNKVVPAGQYMLQSATIDGTALILHNVRAKVGMILPDRSNESKKPAESYALVFKKYGDQHFLWKIQIKGSRLECQLPQSKAEAELRARNVHAEEVILLASVTR